MIRDDLSANSANAMMLVTAGNGTGFQRRLSTGALTQLTSGPSVAAPYWVRLTRVQDLFTGYTSSDGANWSLVGSAVIPMSGSVRIGLALTSHNDGVLATAEFDNVSVLGGGQGSDTEAPTQPQNLQAAVTSDTAIDLSWDASSDNTGVTGYNVYLSTDLTTPLNGSPVAGLVYTVTGLTADTPYSFQVTALDAAGNESTPSAAAGDTTDAAP